ncbi:glycosyltransferase family 4 protein [Nanoarchaeota archaeon]
MIAYILKYFPKLSETFIHEEIYQLQELHNKINIYSLINSTKHIKHEKVMEVLSKSNLKSYSNNIKGLISNIIFYPHLLFKIPELFIRVNIRKLIQDIKKDKPDHLHTHFLWENAYLTYYVSKKLKIPFTITSHAKDIFIPNKRRILKVAKNAKKIITISKYNKRVLESYGVKSINIEVIHCGIDDKEFKPTKNKKTKTLKILGVGRLIEKKGFIHLLQAAKQLAKDNKQFQIDIVGGGPLKNKLSNYIRQNNLKKHVKLHGHMIDKDVRKLLKSCDVFILPCVKSDSGDMDGIPVSLMEAIAMGKPVISSPISGIPELINNKNGILAKPKDLYKVLKNFKFNKKPILDKSFYSKNTAKKLLKVIEN